MPIKLAFTFSKSKFVSINLAIKMEKHIVYIITDSNRAYLEVGQCTDLNTRIQEIRSASNVIFSSTPKLSNIVHVESFENAEAANARQQQLQQFTRMQRERLIRTKNPNWLNLQILANGVDRQKVAAYA